MVKTTGTPVPQNLTPTLLDTINVSSAVVLGALRFFTPVRSGLMKLSCRVVGGFTGPTTARRIIGWVDTDFTSKTDKYGRSLSFYPVYVSEGTGRYRARDSIRANLPTGRPKKGTNKNIRYEYNGGWVSAKSVKGQRPQRIVERAIAQSRSIILMSILPGALHTVKLDKIHGAMPI